jgi:membrane-associated PAP2 superfamily phosphatase
MLIRAFFTDRCVRYIFLVYVLALVLLDLGGGDLWLATKLYVLEGNQWSLQEHWLTQGILHKGARKVNYLLCATVLIFTVYYLYHYQQNAHRAHSFAALSLSLLCSFALVAYLKAITNIACPWSLSQFGGIEPYIHLFQHRPAYLPYSQCFPAGHASVGYVWVALYYFLAQLAPRRRYAGLFIGLTLGLIFGFTQQLRGAHFISHDITTLALCLLCAKLCFMVLCNPAPTAKEIGSH